MIKCCVACQLPKIFVTKHINFNLMAVKLLSCYITVAYEC